MKTQRTRAIASRSSLHVARIEFLARSTSSKEAPSDKPSSFSAFSTDISNGAESSARDPARRTVVDNERREGAETALHHRRWPFAAVIVMPIWAVSGSRAQTVVVVPPPQRMARAGKVVAICCVGWELRGWFGYFIGSVLLRRREIQKAVNFADVWYWNTVQGTSVNYPPFDEITSLLIKSCEYNFGKQGKIMKVEIRKSFLFEVLKIPKKCTLLWMSTWTYFMARKSSES